MPRKQVLIAGASGLVGYAAMRSFGADPDLGQGFLRTNAWFSTAARLVRPQISSVSQTHTLKTGNSQDNREASQRGDRNESPDAHAVHREKLTPNEA